MIRWEVTTLDGHLVGHVGPERSDGTVTIPLSDGRTGELTISLFDELVERIEALKVILRARYFGEIVFAGVVQIPDHQGGRDALTMNAADPARRLDAAPLVDPRVTYSSLDQVVEATRSSRYGFPDAPDHGIKAQPSAALAPQPPWSGLDTSVKGSLAPGRGPFPRLELSSGATGWSVFMAASQSMFGPEFRLRPIEHEPGTWDYVTLDVAARLGEERQDDPACVFHFGWGANNLVDMGYAPGGDRVVNAYFTEIAATDEDADPTVVAYTSPDEINEVGFYAGYEGSGGCTGAAGSAISQVVAYRFPPQFFTITLAVERVDEAGTVLDYGHYVDGQWIGGAGAPPRFGRDYDVGDTIRAVAHRGYFREALVGRVVSAELREVDDNGSVQVTLSCVPRVSLDGLDAETTEFGDGTYSGFPGDEVAPETFRDVRYHDLTPGGAPATPPPGRLFRGIVSIDLEHE